MSSDRIFIYGRESLICTVPKAKFRIRLRWRIRLRNNWPASAWCNPRHRSGRSQAPGVVKAAEVQPAINT